MNKEQLYEVDVEGSRDLLGTMPNTLSLAFASYLPYGSEENTVGRQPMVMARVGWGYFISLRARVRTHVMDEAKAD